MIYDANLCHHLIHSLCMSLYELVGGDTSENMCDYMDFRTFVLFLHGVMEVLPLSIYCAENHNMHYEDATLLYQNMLIAMTDYQGESLRVPLGLGQALTIETLSKKKKVNP